jgi:hypothetical protein
VNVADLQRFLSSLGEALRAAEARKVAGELADLCSRMEPLRDRTLTEFASLVQQAAGIAREQPGKPNRAVKDPDRVQRAASRVRQLYDQALDPMFDSEAVKAEVGKLASLTGSELEEVAKAVGVVRKFRKKEETVKAILQAILDRQGAHKRAGA